MLTVTKPISRRSPPAHALSGRRRGSKRIVQAGMVGLGDRPSSGPGSQDGPVVSVRGAGAGGPPPGGPDPLAPFAGYVAAGFADDPHLWASALFDEVVPLGYDRSYVSFARQLRLAGLRPHCEACTGVGGRETIEISHPAGEEIQWDWFERRRAPWAGTAYVLLGTLSHSGRTRGVLAGCMDQAHLVEAMDAVCGAWAAPPVTGGPTGWPR